MNQVQKDDNAPEEFTTDELKILKELIHDRQWWDEALSRMKKIGIIAASFFTVLAFLAVWWPWITTIMQAVLKDVPK
jgi:hypothetical protein